MSQRATFKNEIVRNYLRRFPNTPSQAIARKIYNENSQHFGNLELTVSMVRYCRGLCGKKNRKKLADKSQKIKKGTFTENPFKLPESDAHPPGVFKLPKKHNNILVLADLHIPYHDIKAITVALEYGKKNKINTIFINGDLIDFYQISRFVNMERRRSVADELDLVRAFLGVLNKQFPGIPIYFLLGNHDLRLQKYLAVKSPELLDVENFKLEELLEAKKYNMTIIENTTLVKMGGLNVTHGDLLLKGFFSPVNPARGTFLKAKDNALISHSHRVSTHTENTIEGKIKVCYSTGCLCELAPTYQPFGNNFNHGFAHVIVDGDEYSVKNLQILKGKIIN